MSLSHLLLRRALLEPQRDAIFDGIRPWASHGQWAARSAGLARRLQQAGLGSGDRVVQSFPNEV